MSFAQRLTNSLTVTQTTGSFLESDFSDWVNKNNLIVKKLGKSYYVVKGVTDGNNALVAKGPVFGIGVSLKDMGKEKRIGTQTELSLRVFRKVQIPGLAKNNGQNLDEKDVYVLIERNSLPGDYISSDDEVHVSRT